MKFAGLVGSGRARGGRLPGAVAVGAGGSRVRFLGKGRGTMGYQGQSRAKKLVIAIWVTEGHSGEMPSAGS
jgi:hypothetical protein